jgi:hypothetical protein
LTPGVIEHDFATYAVDLRAQVSGATVQTDSWDVSQAPDATAVTGQSTYRLQFTWRSFTGAARSNQITLTTTNVGGGGLSQTLTFSVIATDSPAWSSTPPTSVSTWPTVLPPDALTARQETVDSQYYRLGLATGEVQTSHTLPAYNPGVPPLTLLYSSTAADRLPIFLEHYQLDPSQSAPATVTAQLTLNSVAGPVTTYTTSLLNPGDILEIAVQGNASSLTTGRYAYSLTVTANYVPPVPTTVREHHRFAQQHLGQRLVAGQCAAGLAGDGRRRAGVAARSEPVVCCRRE